MVVLGVDVFLIGFNDFVIELGVLLGFRIEMFKLVLVVVSKVCKKYGKIMGLVGIYD